MLTCITMSVGRWQHRVCRDIVDQWVNSLSVERCGQSR